jgi:hypothetical protein
MPLSSARVLKQFRYAVYFDGVDDYVVIPLTVYGWPGITVQEWLYPYHPKANIAWSKTGMIGDPWNRQPFTYHFIGYDVAYTIHDVEFGTRRPDGTIAVYRFSAFAYKNVWVNIARRFSLTDRVFAGYINGVRVYTATVPSTEATVLEWNPDTATYPWMYRRFVLGANVWGGENMKMMQASILIYSRALSDDEIKWNYNNPDNPVRDGLVLWLRAHPDNIKDIDGDGLLEWLDLSGFNNHGKIYGATLVKLIRDPVR